MNTDQKSSCSLIIHGASTAAAAIGAGLAQLPLADSAALAPLQITMIISIGRVFGQHVTDSAAKALALSVAAGFVGRAASQLLIGWVPFLGNLVNAATAAGLTEFIGWGVAERFDKNTTL